MSKRVTLFLLLILPLAGNVYSQDTRKLQELFMEAEYFLFYEAYYDALMYYKEIYEEMPENANLAYRIGICYLNIEGSKNLAIEYLEKASQNTTARYREGSVTQMGAPYEAIFFLGEAYRINYQFDKAREAFKRYRETLLPGDTENIAFVEHQIEVCDFAEEFIANPVNFTKENIGAHFNDERSNFNPVISADGNTFAFMVTLTFYDAIMLSRREGEEWSPPVNIFPELQVEGTVRISSLSADGNTLLLTINDHFESNIYMSRFDGTRWAPAERLNRNINTRNWESHGFLSECGEYLVFASDRPGGFGGLDLYISKKEGDSWGPARNMGPEINTPFNEDRPFLVNGLSTIFFCSQGHRNMGGYDLFRSERQPNDTWSEPENLGYPVNTPDDDTFFMPINGGRSGFVSWSRPGTENFGREDIYLITFPGRR